MPLTRITSQLISIPSNYPLTGSLNGTASYATTASFAMNGGSGGSGGTVQTGSIANQTILYNVTTSQDNIISGLNLSSNKWDVSVIEEWNSGSGDIYYPSSSVLLHFSGSNNSTTISDSGPNNVSITVSGGAKITSSFSKFGGTSLFLGGTNGNYLTIPVVSGGPLDVNNQNFTVECYIYLTATTTGLIASRYNSNAGSGNYNWDLSLTSTGKLQGLISQFNNNNSYNTITGLTTLATNTWHHIAYVKSSSLQTLFLNGNIDVSGSITITTSDSGQAIRIGTSVNSDGSTNAPIAGYIDEFRITKNVVRYTGSFTTSSLEFPNQLPQYETKYVGLVGGLNDTGSDYGVQKLSDSSLKIRKMSVSGTPVSGSPFLSASVDRVYVNVLDYTNVMVTSSNALTSSYVDLNNIVLTGTTTGDAYYPQVAALLHFDGVNGSTVITDNSKNNLYVTASNGAAISTAQSKFGGASVLFDGTNDNLTIASNSVFDFGTNDFTIEFWVYFNALSTSRMLVERWTTGNANSWQIYWRSTGTSIAFLVGSSTILLQDSNTTRITTGQWYHIAVTRSSSTNRLFINGTQVASATDSTSLTNSLPLAIGTQTSTGTNYLNGYIDELRITNGYARYTSNFTTSSIAFADGGGDIGKALVVNSTATGVSIGTAGFNLNSSNINRIINGAMAIDQRNAGASQTITAAAALAYTVDRWYAYCTGANVTGQRITGSANNQYAYRFTGAASVTGIGFGQRIEAANSFDLAGSTVTLGVDLANSVLTSVTWTVYYANTSDTFGTLASPTRTQISTGTFTVNSTLSRYSTQIFIPSAATTGIEIVFSVGAQTSGTWTIDNVQLEAGPLATPFERRLVGSELNLCYRYFVNLNGGTNPYQQLGFGTFYSSTNGAYIINLPAQMRTLPVVSSTGTIYIVSLSSTNFINLTGFLGPYSQIGTILEGDFTVASGGTVGATGLIRWNNVSPSSRTFFVSSEL